jgi:glycerophosphoryl diester phosphodiesterase
MIINSENFTMSNTSYLKKTTSFTFGFSAVLASILLFSTVAEAAGNNRWQVSDVVQGSSKPFAIGHRGFGENLGENRLKPIENTVASVREAYRNSVSMVEVDVQVTADGHAVVFHDDVLADGTCVNNLTLKQLRRAAGEIPTLKRILRVAHTFTNKKDFPSGILDIEIKAASPNCDPQDEFDEQLAEAVVSDVFDADMVDQVLIESFSPQVIALAATMAPEIARVLSVSALQFLTPEQVTGATGWNVLIIDKTVGFGLEWSNIGGFFRLPGYDSIEQFAGVALALGSTAIDIDIQLLQQAEATAPGTGSYLVNSLQSYGVSVWSFTVQDTNGWEFLSSLGIDGIFIDDIPLGVRLQSLDQ